LSHSLEILPEREWELTNNESTKNITNTREHHNIKDTLNVLLEHSTHHVWVLKHSHLIESVFLVKETCIRCAKVRFTLFNTCFWEVITVLSNSWTSDHGSSIFTFWFNFSKTHVEIDFNIIFLNFVWISFAFKNGVSQVSVTNRSGFGQWVWLSIENLGHVKSDIVDQEHQQDHG